MEKCDEEAKRQVPAEWKEDATTIWESASSSYTSALGGPKEPGPSTTIKTTIANQPVSQCDLVA